MPRYTVRMDSGQRLQYLQAMGIQSWVLRQTASAPSAHSATCPEPASPPIPRDESRPPRADTVSAVAEPGIGEPEPGQMVSGDPGLPVEQLDWEALEARVSQCTLCPELVQNRRRTVFGVGDRQADWMIVGEAPGAEEDKQGEPFVGRAGKLLNAMLKATGYERREVFIANVLKCRPPGNRDPKPEEARNCGAYLRRQVELVSPRLILVVGRIAAQNLLNTDQPLGKLRGRVHRYADTDIPVIVTYHPAYLLRSPADKAKAWQDLKLARRTAAGQG